MVGLQPASRRKNRFYRKIGRPIQFTPEEIRDLFSNQPTKEVDDENIGKKQKKKDHQKVGKKNRMVAR